MKHIKLLIGGASIVALAGGSLTYMAASATTVSPLTRVTGAIDADTNIPVEQWQSATRLPILPANGLAEIREGSPLVFSRLGGLVDLDADLNGSPQHVERTGDTFVVSIGSITGSGAASLTIHERFDDSTTVTLPLTVFVNDSGLRRATEPSVVTRKPIRTLLLPWGTDDSSVGRVIGNEADTLIPTSFAALPNGSVAVLDSANQRVLSVDERGATSVIAKLSSVAFNDLINDPGVDGLVAIDPVNAVGIVVADGRSIPLPPLVSRLPLGLEYSFDGIGRLYVQSPADAVPYSIGVQVGSSKIVSEGDMMRSLGTGRVTVDGATIHVQPVLTQSAVNILLSDTEHFDIVDSLALDDGRMVSLISTITAGRTAFELLVVGAGSAERTPIDIQTPGTMTRRLATDGSTLLVLGGSDDGVSVTFFSL